MIKKLLSTFAPILGGLIGGPVGATVLKTVASVLMPGEENPSDSRIEEALKNATPEQIVEIERINKEYEISLAEIGFKDRDSARNMSIQRNDNTSRNMMYTLTFLLGLRIFVPLFHPLEISNELTDVLCDGFMLCLGFFVGRKQN
jgi:hypothetical protein